MTVQNTNRKDVYLTNGKAIYWPYTFEIFTTNGSDIKLYETNISTGDTVEITENFTRDIDNDRIKYPTSGEARPTGYKITVARVTERTQGATLSTQSFDPKNMEKGLDRLTAIVQELDETVSRAAISDISNQNATYEFPAPAPAKVIGWNFDGTEFVNYDNPASAAATAETAAITATTQASNASLSATNAANSELNAATLIGSAKSNELNMLGVWPWLGKKIKKNVLTFTSDDLYCYSLAFDGTSIYALTDGKLIKIDPQTMTTVESLMIDSYSNLMTFDGTYLYLGTFSSPARIIKIDPKTMTTVGTTLTLATGETKCRGIISDGTYIYVGLETSPAKIVKINPTTMTTVGTTLTLATGEDNCYSFTFDGTYIYAGLHTSPGKIVKINPQTMTTVGTTLTLDEATYEDDVDCLIFDGTYIYAGLYVLRGQIIKINPNGSGTMTKVGSTLTLASGEDDCQTFTFDGTYLYVGLMTSPAKIVKIDPKAMAKVSTLTLPTNVNNCKALTFDGTYIYAGCSTMPGKVAQYDLFSAF